MLRRNSSITLVSTLGGILVLSILMSIYYTPQRFFGEKTLGTIDNKIYHNLDELAAISCTVNNTTIYPGRDGRCPSYNNTENAGFIPIVFFIVLILIFIISAYSLITREDLMLPWILLMFALFLFYLISWYVPFTTNDFIAPILKGSLTTDNETIPFENNFEFKQAYCQLMKVTIINMNLFTPCVWEGTRLISAIICGTIVMVLSIISFCKIF